MKKHMLLIGDATERTMNKFQEFFEVHAAGQIDDMAAFLENHGANIVAIATNGHDGVPTDTLRDLPNVEIISCYGVGYDSIPVEPCVSRGITVTHTPNVLNNDVANTAIMLMLAVSRRLVRDDNWVRSGAWKSTGNAPLTRSIEGKKIGILGLGRIGETIGRKLQAGFDCDISYHSRNKRHDVAFTYFESLEGMARSVDYLVAITPGGAATHHLVGRAVMDALGPDGTLINVGRGSVVDEAELVLALQEKRLGNAGLDVFEAEPTPLPELLAMENVVLTPHVGSATEETRQAMGDLTVENLISFFETGKALTPIPECEAQ